MLSVGRIAAGDGYRYLTSQVASHDATRAGERLVSYYERTGMPPGVWAGAQASAFGLEGPPTEEQMERLYGRCADPNTGAVLGRRMAEFRPLAERIAARIGGLGRTATDDERAAISRSEAARGQPQAVAAFDLTFSAPLCRARHNGAYAEYVIMPNVPCGAALGLVRAQVVVLDSA